MNKIIIALAALATLSTASLARTDIDPRDRANGDINAASSAFVLSGGGSAVTSDASAFAVEGGSAGETAFQRQQRLHNLYEFSGH
jgi:hypothetical protein